jgi:hypothetical protein
MRGPPCFASAQNSVHSSKLDIGRSRSSTPRSTRRIAVTAEIVLVTEAMLYGVCSVAGRRASTSAQP